MATIIKASCPLPAAGQTVQQVAFNFSDMSAQADRYLDDIRGHAAKIIQEAHQQAQTIRQEAELQGREAAMQAMERTVEQKIAQQMQTVLPALASAVEQIRLSQQNWLEHWQRRAVHLAVAIAQRVIRREVSREPQITIDLVIEGLRLAAGSADVTIHLHPQDAQALGAQVKLLADEMRPAAPATVVADAKVSPGGCRVETRFGTIDQQLEVQLKRIEEELQ